VGRILRNGRAQLAVLDPESSELRVFQDDEFHPYHPAAAKLPKAMSSIEWYAGRREDLEFAAIEGDDDRSRAAHLTSC
jgi:hypothetical protein